MGFVFGEVDTELPAAAVPGDTDANAAVPAVVSRGQLWTGTGWERERGHEPARVLLAPADRTATTTTPQQSIPNARGFYARLAVGTVGTGTLRLDFLSSNTFFSFTARSAAGTHLFMLYPGLPEIVGDLTLQRANLVLPHDWNLRVVPSDASIWNYQLIVATIV